MLKRFISYYKPHKLVFALDMLSSLGVSLIGIVYPMVTRTMLNDLIPNRNYRMIVIFGMTLLLLYAVKMMLNYFIQYVGHVMGVKMQAQMRRDMFEHLEKLPYSFYDTHETGKIMSRMTNDLMDISELAHHGPENIIISTISIVASFIYLSTIDIYLTLIIFCAVPFLLLIAMLLKNKMHKAFSDSRKSVAVINAALESSISGIRVTKAFTNADKEGEKFEEGNKSFVEARSDAYNAMGQFHSGTTFVTDVFNVIVLIAGGLFLYNGKISFGDYSAFVVSINMFISPVMTLINFMEQYQNGVTGFERFIEILDEEPETDSPNAVDIGDVKGHIELKDISYAYTTTEDGEEEKEVIDHLSLDIKQGETFALVGPSGGGKTTLANIISRFFDADEGQVFIGGVDVKEIPKAKLMETVSFVFQNSRLLKGSILENVRMARPSASEEDVLQALTQAQCIDIIAKLPDGIHTILGTEGIYLSGGEQQRIALARAILKDAPIVLLDEATAFADPENEHKIQMAFERLTQGKTVLMIAHRLPTIQNADEILVLEQGTAAERGTHDSLMARNGIYASMWRDYQTSVAWNIGKEGHHAS